jgi:hypothetical protein
MVLLVFVAISTPIRLAFYDEDTTDWLIINIVTDFSFFVDLILTFFCPYKDEKTLKKVTDRKLIALRYLKTWFFMDMISIFPFDYFLTATDIN